MLSTLPTSPSHTLTKKNLKKLFNYLDVDGSGDLDKDEFERAFFHLEIYIRSKDVDDLFNTYSKQESLDNPKRGINFESFRLVLREIVKRPKGSSKIARTLQKVATGAMSLIGTSPTKKSENTGIRSKGIDDDGDKKDDANARSLPSRDDLRSIFGHMDRDGSGGVDRAEMILTLRHLGMYRSEEQVRRRRCPSLSRSKRQCSLYLAYSCPHFHSPRTSLSPSPTG